MEPGGYPVRIFNSRRITRMNDSISFLMDLIRTRPVTQDIEAVNRAAAKVRVRLESAGIRCVMEKIGGRDTLYASLVPGKTPDYLFNAHLDVVAARPEQFEPVLSPDGVLAGRGACDCLGPASAIVDALLALKAKGGASCGAIFTTDEETGGQTTLAMVERGYHAKKAIVIVDGEYASVCIAQKGILTVKLTRVSKEGGGHASEPWAMENPIDTLLDAYHELRSEWKNPTASEPWGDSMAATVISGGSVHNQIPESASMILNFRLTEETGEARVLERLQRLPGIRVEALTSCPPVVFSEDEPVFLKLKEIYGKYLPGRDIPFVRMNGATDARHFHSLNVPLAILGVDGEGLHGAKETLRTDSLRVISSVLTDFCS